VSGLLGQALAYAARGWPVFPCKPGLKVPAIPRAHERGNPCRGECGSHGHGFHDATTDPAVIEAWWRCWPQANIGLATGAPGPDVLDVDVHQGGAGWPALNRVKRAGLLTGAAAMVRTRSGGLHIYYAGTGQPPGSLPRHHLDFRSAGGYVLAPPSFVEADDKGPAGTYELLEERPATGRLDWQAVKRVLNPPRRPQAHAVRWTGGELPPGVQRALAADAADRSAALHRLVGACVRAGMDEDTIHELAGSYQPALEKYGARLGTEVERSLRRIGA
jgi:hypothetical protein